MGGAAADDDEKRLHLPAEAAQGTQRELTAEVEEARRRDLESLIDALPTTDRRRVAYHANAKDRWARVWVSGIPDGATEGAPPRAFVEGVASYLGTASPCSRPLVGQHIYNKDGAVRATVDTYGDSLAATSLVGGGWTRHHDAVKNAMCDVMQELGLNACVEVWNLFSPLIPPGARRAPLDAPGIAARQMRQGLVPDIRMDLPPGLGTATDAASRTQLGEVKTIHHCRSRYSDGDVDTGVFGAAVQRRAGTLAAEYERGARKLDTEYGTTPPGADGPCLQRLRGFGDIAAFVLGASGEVSKDFERWVACVAATRAAAMRRIMGARTDVQARGCIAWRVRRRVGWAAFIAAAQLKIDRCEFVGPSGAEAARRRAYYSWTARQAHERAWENACAAERDAARRRQRPPRGGH